MLYERNQTLEARRLLEDRLEVLERVSIPTRCCAYCACCGPHTGWAATRRNRWPIWNRLEDYATKGALDRLLAYSLSDRVSRRLLPGRPARSRG